jgi:hypothetical protein
MFQTAARNTHTPSAEWLLNELQSMHCAGLLRTSGGTVFI